MSSWLARIASRAPVRIFVLAGRDPPAAPELLRALPGVQVVDSPRSATVLLVTGILPPALHEPARRVHDQLAHPRATLCWSAGDAVGVGEAATAPFVPARIVAGSPEEVAVAAAVLQRALLHGEWPSEPSLLPDVEPNAWRGIGPFGQGGTGMTGGVPYGRPMAETAADRDGLRLDQLQLAVGPFFPPFPPGLILDLQLQGDVVQQATVRENPFASAPVAESADPFRRALDTPELVRTLEMARARHHLAWFATMLHVHGLTALGVRALRLRAGLRAGEDGPLVRFARILERTWALGWATAKVGMTSAAEVGARGLGPVARAAGCADDARTADPAYARLGFVPCVGEGGDAQARWRQRLAEAIQSVSLAGRAGGGERSGGTGRVEAPRGLLTHGVSATAPLLALLPPLLAGASWGDAVTTVVSLDADLRDLPPAAAGSSDAAGGRESGAPAGREKDAA